MCVTKVTMITKYLKNRFIDFDFVLVCSVKHISFFLLHFMVCILPGTFLYITF